MCCHPTDDKLERRQRVSASIVYKKLHDRSADVPTFSIDGGLVLHPSFTRVLCAFGVCASHLFAM